MASPVALGACIWPTNQVTPLDLIRQCGNVQETTIIIVKGDLVNPADRKDRKQLSTSEG